VLLVVGAAFLAWYVAGHWNRWTGAARYESTDDAYTFGDVTPLSAKVSGYIQTVAINDYQPVRKGDLIVEIDPSDYWAALEQAQAGLSAAQAVLANLANQKDIQRALTAGGSDHPRNHCRPGTVFARSKAPARSGFNIRRNPTTPGTGRRQREAHGGSAPTQ
jgi:multidrug resistance efflux pump